MAVVNSVYIFRDLVDLSKLQKIYPEKNRAKMFTHRPEWGQPTIYSVNAVSEY